MIQRVLHAASQCRLGVEGAEQELHAALLENAAPVSGATGKAEAKPRSAAAVFRTAEELAAIEEAHARRNGSLNADEATRVHAQQVMEFARKYPEYAAEVASAVGTLAVKRPTTQDFDKVRAARRAFLMAQDEVDMQQAHELNMRQRKRLQSEDFPGYVRAETLDPFA